MALIMQSKPQLHQNPSMNNQKGNNRSLSKCLSCLLLSFAMAFLYFNLQMIFNLSSGSTPLSPKLRALKEERHPLPATFPMLPKQTPPSANTIQAWDEWAEPPLYRSYQYSPTSSIHFPYMELQLHFHDTKPNFQTPANRRTGKDGNGNGAILYYPPAQALAQRALVDSDFLLLTRKGNKFHTSGVKANQDRAVIVSPFHKEGDWFLGLMDGHGPLGHVVAHKASIDLPKMLLERIPSASTIKPKQIQSILSQSFMDIHHSLDVNILGGSGSTAISMLKLGDTLYISNVGDSLAFVVQYDEKDVHHSVEIIYQTKPHKPDDPMERKRIEAAKGTVIDSPFAGASARLLINMPNGDQAALAMSRSLGDSEGDRVGHLAEPTTDVLDLRNLMNHKNANTQPGKKFLCICASDGLLDKVTPLQVAQHVATSFLKNSPLLPLEAAEQLLLQASKGWLTEVMGGDYRDDMTIAVHKLELE